VGGLTEPLARIVKRAGTRTLIAPVGVLAVVFVVAVAVVFGGAVRVVVVAGGVVAEVVAGAGVGALGVDELEVDFEPPHPATASTPKRTASPLTFAG